MRVNRCECSRLHSRRNSYKLATGVAATEPSAPSPRKEGIASGEEPPRSPGNAVNALVRLRTHPSAHRKRSMNKELVIERRLLKIGSIGHRTIGRSVGDQSFPSSSPSLLSSAAVERPPEPITHALTLLSLPPLPPPPLEKTSRMRRRTAASPSREGRTERRPLDR